MLLFYTGWRQIQSIVVGKPEEIITVQEIIKGKKFKQDYYFWRKIYLGGFSLVRPTLSLQKYEINA